MYERFSYGIGALGICVVVALQQIWKEKQLEYGENDKELDDYQQPQLRPTVMLRKPSTYKSTTRCQKLFRAAMIIRI